MMELLQMIPKLQKAPENQSESHGQDQGMDDEFDNRILQRQKRHRHYYDTYRHNAARFDLKGLCIRSLSFRNQFPHCAVFK